MEKKDYSLAKRTGRFEDEGGVWKDDIAMDEPPGLRRMEVLGGEKVFGGMDKGASEFEGKEGEGSLANRVTVNKLIVSLQETS